MIKIIRRMIKYSDILYFHYTPYNRNDTLTIIRLKRIIDVSGV